MVNMKKSKRKEPLGSQNSTSSILQSISVLEVPDKERSP